ncbi:MAG: regulatory protein RecX [Bdellovibrionales bacterium]
MKTGTQYIPTPQSLSHAALQYLGRYAASEASLRRVLINRLRRAAMQNQDFREDEKRQETLRQAIEQIIEKHRKSGALNDAAFAETKVNSLRRTGRSQRAILQKLKAKGISTTLIKEALDQNADEKSPEEAEMTAALALLRRRKMGPFRRTPENENIRRRELAALARAGFSLNIARRALRQGGEE